jgi:flagellar basal body-associated protein FliL
MNESQWAQKQGKGKKYLWLVIVFAALCVAAVIFLRNNSEILWGSADQHAQKKDTARAPDVAIPEKSRTLPAAPAEKKLETVSASQGRPAAAPAGPKEVPKAAPSVSGSVLLEKITCTLVDKSRPSLRLSLALVFPENGALRQEILVKRDNLKVMVKRTLATKSMDDIVIDSLRKDLKSVINSLLENGAISDIEFKEFSLDKVE